MNTGRTPTSTGKLDLLYWGVYYVSANIYANRLGLLFIEILALETDF